MKRFLLNFIPLLLLLSPVISHSSPLMIKGTIQGFNCTTQGKFCPSGKEDPVVGTESTFVLLTSEGKYYYVPNVDRTVMARHVTEEARIYGILDKKYNSIEAQIIETKMDNKWKIVYSSSFSGPP